MFLVEEEGTASTFRALLEVFGGRHGLPLSLYYGSRQSLPAHSRSRRPGGSRPADPGQRARAGGIWASSISPAYSPRGARPFGAIVSHLAGSPAPKELALTGITTIAQANAWLRETYIAAHNARFATTAEQEGSAFVAVPGLADLAEVLCVEEERVVGNDNCVSFLHRKLHRYRKARCVRTYTVRATVKVHQYPDGGLAVFHGRRCLEPRRAGGKGVPVGEPPRAQSPQSKEDTGPSRRQARAPCSNSIRAHSRPRCGDLACGKVIP